MRVPARRNRIGEEKGEMESNRNIPFFTLPFNGKPLYLLLFSFTVGATAAIVGGCGLPLPGGDSMARTTPINMIQNKREGRRVYLQGTIAQTAPFLDNGAYQLQDATGTIWVITPQDLPPVGEEMFIKGTVRYHSVPISGQEFGEFYIEEKKQLDPDT